VLFGATLQGGLIMRVLTGCLLGAIASGYGFAAAACEPPAPLPMPHGAPATRHKMLASQAQVRAYQAAMTEFLACIDSEQQAEGEQAPDEFKALMVDRHNAAVAEMAGVGG